MGPHSKTTQSVKPKPGQIVELEVQGMGSFGEGIAKYNDYDVFIPKTTTKDVVRVRILEEKKGRFRADLIEVLKPSPNRRSPRCQHFQECGGCDFQHLSYEEQIAWKVRQTKHWIRRSPLAPQLDHIGFDEIKSPHEYHYRHRVRLQLKGGKLHFFKPHSHQLLELNECPILAESFFEKLIETGNQNADRSDWNQSFREGKLVQTEASYELDQCTIRFDPECFTQANPFVNELMWNRIRDDILEVESRNFALDLFCGIGNFSLPLENYFEHVIGVESSEASLKWAKANSETVDWRCGDSAKILQQLGVERKFFDFVLLDPPRAGALEVCRLLGAMRPPRITYVSCSLESLIVDLTHLCKKQGYRIKRWTVADMFPQTHHIESIVSLVPQ